MLNDRIEQLANQATEYCKSQPREIAGSMWETKFAELIIKECAEVADKNFNRGFSPVGQLVKDHFGVK